MIIKIWYKILKHILFKDRKIKIIDDYNNNKLNNYLYHNRK